MSERRRFVILTHDHPVLHWDLMLDAGETLRTWRLETVLQSDVEVRAVALPDHRRLYLDYVGPVSGDRGTVTRWAQGQYLILAEEPTCLTFEVESDRITGVVQMERSSGEEDWIVIFRGSSRRDGGGEEVGSSL